MSSLHSCRAWPKRNKRGSALSGAGPRRAVAMPSIASVAQRDIRQRVTDRFRKLVEEARKTITEISPVEAARKVRESEATIVDVRENDEWEEEHISGALHLNRGTVELEIQDKI